MPGPASTGAPPAVQRRALRCLINRARRHAGVAPLRDQAELDRSAAMRAAAIRRCNDFSHTPCGEAFLTVFATVHYLTVPASVGENLGWGQGRLGSARATMASWLRSALGRAKVTIRVAQFGRRAGS